VIRVTTPLRRRLDSLTIREVDGELLVLDTSANRIHQLNRMAALIWQSCDSADSPEDIADRIAAEFDVDREVALADVRRLLEDFRTAGLLAPE